MSGCSRAGTGSRIAVIAIPLNQAAVFLKKTPPATAANSASEFWNRSKTLRRQRGDRRFNSGQPLHDCD